MKEEEEFACPGEMLGKTTELIAGSGTYVSPLSNTIRSSLFGRHHILLPPPNADHQKPTIEVVRHKAHGSVPQPGSIVIAWVTKVMARMASADIMCVGSKSVREKFTGMIRQQDVRATEIDKVDMHLSFRPGDIVRAMQFQVLPSFIIIQASTIIWAISWGCKGLLSFNCKE